MRGSYAFELLHSYLESLRAHFAMHEGRDEILSDLESRIAERLEEAEHGRATRAVTLEDLDAVVESIGRPDRLAEPADIATGPTTSRGPEGAGGGSARRLYRDPAAGVLAGVCTGLGAYFGVPAALFRLAFVVLTFAFGGGAVLYVLFWLFVPPAQTSVERLTMRGVPVTLAAVAQLASRGEPVPPATQAERVLAAPLLWMRRVVLGTADRTGRVATAMAPLLRRTIAGVMMLGATLAILFVFLGVGLSLVGLPDAYLDATYERFLRGVSEATLVGAGAVVIFVPAVFLLLAGISLLRSRDVPLSFPVATGLVAAWFLAAVAGGIEGTRSVMEWQAFANQSPEYQFDPGRASPRGADVGTIGGCCTSMRGPLVPRPQDASGRPALASTSSSSSAEAGFTRKASNPDSEASFRSFS